MFKISIKNNQIRKIKIPLWILIFNKGFFFLEILIHLFIHF